MSEEALQIAVKSKEEKDTHLNAEFQRIARRDKKAFLNDQCKETLLVFFVCLFFHAERHVGSYFPDQGLNLGHGSESLES